MEIDKNLVEIAPSYESFVTGKWEIMCYHCSHHFISPKCKNVYTRVKCPNCKKVESRQHYRADNNDPLKHPLGWPYSDPTIPYDC